MKTFQTFRTKNTFYMSFLRELFGNVIPKDKEENQKGKDKRLVRVNSQDDRRIIWFGGRGLKALEEAAAESHGGDRDGREAAGRGGRGFASASVLTGLSHARRSGVPISICIRRHFSKDVQGLSLRGLKRAADSFTQESILRPDAEHETLRVKLREGKLTAKLWP